jgi:hypothetical protein
LVLALLAALLVGAVASTLRFVRSPARPRAARSPVEVSRETPTVVAEVEPTAAPELVGGWPADWLVVRGCILRHGEPWAGARVTAQEDLGSMRERGEGGIELWSSESAVADADGRFRLAVPREGRYWIDVDVPTPPKARLDVMHPIEVAPDDVGEHRIDVRTGSASGRVLGPDGAPVAECQVGFHQFFALEIPTGRDLYDLDAARGSGFAWTDEDGRYAITLPTGEVHLRAPENFPGDEIDPRPFLADGHRIVVEPGAHLEDVDFRLPPAGHVAGRVARADGTIVAGAEIRIRHPGSKREMRWTSSKPDGSYRVKAAPGALGLAASSDEGGSSWHEVLITAGEVQEVELVIEREDGPR